MAESSGIGAESALRRSKRLVDSLAAASELLCRGAQRVERVETHISWVLLAGSLAYKLKKPVDFGFVDFTTLARRKRFCEEELRLNRRLAPRLYRDVVPITGSPEAPTLDGAGEPIEYAVRMNRFNASCLLSDVLARGEWRQSSVVGLARRIASFHQSIPVAPPDSSFGTPDAIRAPVEECLRHLQAIPLDAEDTERLRGIEEGMDAEFAARRELFLRRKAEGRVRECHGDMHLGNMILEPDGSVTVFDGIEFNDGLRWIDVASELAFLTMDLASRGAERLAHQLLSEYLEWTGDYGMPEALPYYQTYRALVRAKVTALQADPGHSKKDQKAGEPVRRYLRQASEGLHRLSPALVIMHGLSGSGKSTVAQDLLETLGAIRLRSDVFRKRLHGVALDDSARATSRTDLYSAEATERTFAGIEGAARELILAGRRVLIDATFQDVALRTRFRALADQLAVPWGIVDVVAGDETLRHRVRLRAETGGDPSDADLAVLESQMRRRTPLLDVERRRAVTVNTETAVNAEWLADEILRVARNF